MIATKQVGLTDDQARKLATRVVKEGVNSLRVKFGKTNGRNVLHIAVPGSKWLSRTIKSESQWEVSELREENARKIKAQSDASKTTVEREQEVDGLLSLIRNKDSQ